MCFYNERFVWLIAFLASYKVAIQTIDQMLNKTAQQTIILDRGV